MLPKLRKSLQKQDAKRISPPSLSQKLPHAIEPPKAVIKALYSYIQSSAQELSFSKGDFFHVVGNENDSNWYEACNPATGARGLVPAQYFQVLGRNAKDSVDMNKTLSHDSGYDEDTDRSAAKSSKTAPLYGIVQYDFQAERPDELDAKAGEAIIIIAQSNHEWFVAKPIGRLGGPGLIPVSFIEIRDMTTGKPISNLEELAAKAAVPKVEEWKKAAAEYKNSSIPLGRFDFDRKESIPREHARTSDYSSGSYVDEKQTNEVLYVAKASVDQFLLDGSRYWFLVRVEMNDGRHRNLCRFYEDFYDFQIALLEAFPIEAGRTGEQRILPFMPGPLAYVDDTISAQRRADLSVYVEELCHLPAHIVRSPLVQALFAAREGDVESAHSTSMMPQPVYRNKADRASATSHVSSNHSGHPRLSNSHSHEGSSTIQRKTHSLNGQRLSTIASTSHNKDNSTSEQHVKIKVFHDEDLIALRVPLHIDYQALRNKLSERVSNGWSSIYVKNEGHGSSIKITNDAELSQVMRRNDKIVLYLQ